MLSFDEDGLDETAPYGPQHSTPVKGKLGNSNSSVSYYPKSKLTISQGKPSGRKEFCNDFDSPNDPVDCKMFQSDEKHNKNQCAHMQQHFIPENDVDISRIPPSEGSRSQLKSLSNNRCCPHLSNKVSSSTTKIQPIANTSKHGQHFEEGENCDYNDKLSMKDSHQCEIQYTPQSFHRSRVQSSSSRQSRMSSTTSRRSEVCCPCSVSRQSNNCPCQRVSDASLSALTSDCCSPKMLHSQGYCTYNHRKSEENLRPECQSSSSRQKLRSHSLPRTGYSGINLCNNSTELERSTLSIADITKASAIFLDKDIIGKQREEIQLLMEELAGRDQELNDLVTSHQKQVRVWEADRDKLDNLQSRLTKYEDELRSKEEELRITLEEMARVQEQKEVDLTQLGKTQADMVKLAERISENSKYIHEIEIQNKALSNSVKDLLVDKKRWEEKEQELVKQLDAKTAESADHQAAIKRLKEKIEALENEVAAIEDKCQRKVQENEAWRAKFFLEKDEAEKLAADCDSKDLTMAKMTQQLQESLQQAVALQKALFTSCEREKCKEEVLHSLRKQHKRTMQELTNIRELYDLQNRELIKQHSAVTGQDKSAKSSLVGRDEFLDKASVILEMRSAGKKPRDGSNSVLNELSESRTDAQFDGDELLNTCHSRLTNVMASPNSELQDFNPNQRPEHFSKDTAHTSKQFNPQSLIAEQSETAAQPPTMRQKPDLQHSTKRDKPNKFAMPALESTAVAHHQPQLHPPSTSSSHTKSEGQLSQQLQSHLHHPPHTLDMQKLHPQQNQQTPDLSHYSTASATSVRNQECKNTSNSKLPIELERVQRHKFHSPEIVCKSHARSPELSPQVDMEKIESKRQLSKIENQHKNPQFQEHSPSRRKSSPKRGFRQEETRSTERSKEAFYRNRSSDPMKVVSPSRNLSREKKCDNQSQELETRMMKKSFNNCHTTENFAVNPIETFKQKHNAQVEMQKSRRPVDKHPAITAQESLGSLISRQADNGDSPMHQQDIKIANNDTELLELSPQKTFLWKGTDSSHNREEVQRKSEATGIIKRQDSYVICKHNGLPKETAREFHTQEKRMESSQSKLSHRENQCKNTHHIMRDNKRERENCSGPCTPARYPSTSDFSNVPFDDELTPADSDGMCRELKRDFKKASHEQSLGAKVIYSSYPAVPKDDCPQKTVVTETPQDPSCHDDDEEKKWSHRESKKSHSSRGTKTARISLSCNKETDSRNSPDCDISPNQRSPDCHGRKRDAKHSNKKNASPEYCNGSSCSPTPKCRSGKSSQAEKLSKHENRMQHSDNQGGDSFMIKQVEDAHSKPSGSSSPEVRANRHERDNHFEDKQCKGQRKQKPESRHRSLENDDLHQEREQEEANCKGNSKEEMFYQPEVLSKSKHPCLSSRPHKASKKYILSDDPINCGNKASYGFSPCQYGTCNLTRETRYSSRQLQSVSLGLGPSVTRSSGLGLTSTKPRGGLYGKSDLVSRHMPSSNSGMTASGSTFSSRNFMPSGVGTYLSHHLSSWYHNSGSGNYALNNNNEIEDHEHTTKEICDNDSGSIANNRSLDLGSLNTNNNNSNNKISELTNLMDTGIEFSQADEAISGMEEPNISNNNIEKPVCIDEISFEETLISDKDRSVEDSIDVQEICPDVEAISVSSSTNVETVPCKPFVIRGPSLYRQLAQIHFSEKTRRYEWVVPPHFDEVQPSPTLTYEVGCENDSYLVTEPSRQSSEKQVCLETENMVIHKREMLDSKSSDESYCTAVSSRASHQFEISNKASNSQTITQSDSGLYSLSSHDGFHMGSLRFQKSGDNLQPFPVSNHGSAGSECVQSSQAVCIINSQAFSLSQEHKSPSSFRTSSFIVPKNSLVVTSPSSVTVTSNCHRGSIVCTIPSGAMVDSFMGVTATHQDSPQHSCPNHKDTTRDDIQSHLPKQSSSLDDVVKKLDFDDTFLDVTTADVIDVPDKMNSTIGNPVVCLESCNSKADPCHHRIKEHLTITRPDGSSFHSLYTPNPEKTNLKTCCQEARDLDYQTKQGFKNTSNQKSAEEDCYGSDVLSETSLSEYFQDISSVLLEPNCLMSHAEEGSLDYKHFEPTSTCVENPVVIKDNDFDVKTKSIGGYGNKLHYVFDPQTLRYVSFLSMDDTTSKDMLHLRYADGDEDCIGKASDINSSDLGENGSVDNKMRWDANSASENHKSFSKPQRIWKDHSVEEVAVHFDDKLSSFLEERDLMESTKMILQGSALTMSPASKLQHLLLESQHLIWALERSSAVPEGLRSNLTHF